MDLHRASGNRRRGLSLAAVTMGIWGALPLALQILLETMDPASIVWYRFLIATLGLGSVLWWRGGLPRFKSFGRREWTLLAVAIGGLATNYITFTFALDLTSPATTQVLIQLGPLLLALGGIAIFGERFTRIQWVGFGVLVTGLALFFGGQVQRAPDLSEQFTLGALILALSASSWAAYGLSQKQLLLQLDSQALMWCIFAGCLVCYTPLVDLSAVRALDGLGTIALLFAACATVVAYGCFSASLEHVEASRVSAVIALVPLATLGSVFTANALLPDRLPAEALSAASLAGAASVVTGSLITALGGTDSA